MKVAYFCSVVAFVFSASTSANAALHDRGNGLVYDDVLNVTWLQDADFFSSGILAPHEEGLWLNYSTAHSFVDLMNRAHWKGYTGWRLPKNLPVNGFEYSGFGSGTFDGSTDVGWNITSTASELSYMYYVNLGLLGSKTPTGDNQVGSGVSSSTVVSVDGVTFNNVRNADYWSQHDTVILPDDHYLCRICAWSFVISHGFQAIFTDSEYPSDNTYVWALRDGDVAAVPEPSSYVLLFFGLGLIGIATRRRGVSAASSALSCSINSRMTDLAMNNGWRL
jgi:hypothetical protein